MLKLTGSQWAWLALLAIALILAQIGQPFPEVAPLHHAPTLGLLLAAPWLLRRWPISDASLGCVVIFFLLHTLGGRYTYTNVPYEDWWHSLTGGDLAALTGWTRNHYDRLVHLAFGVLCVLPVVDYMHLKGMRVSAGLWAAMGFVLSVSALYEIFEWALALTMAGDVADAYNGQQGDMWDAQKDMALAAFGAATVSIVLAVRARGRFS